MDQGVLMRRTGIQIPTLSCLRTFAFRISMGDAARVMSRYPAEEKFLGSFAWARVLERWLSGAFAEAEAALARARKVNPFVERYITGAHELPDEGPAAAGAGAGAAGPRLPRRRAP